MDNKPHALTNEEINEIAALVPMQEMWGAENTDQMAGILQDSAYCVRFDFMSDGPGYVGDLFVIFGVTFDWPTHIIRDQSGKLVIL